MTRFKKLLGIFLTLILMFPLTVRAEEQIDLSRTGSLQLTICKKDGTPISGGSLTIYPVADIVLDEENNPQFKLNDTFAPTNADLSDPQNRNVISYLEDFVKKNKVPGSKMTVDKDGIASFGDRPLGLYLVVQEEPAPKYKAIQSFLISVPNYDEENKVYNYSVEALPKMDTDIEDASSSESSSSESSTSTSTSKSESSSESESKSASKSSSKNSSSSSTKKPSTAEETGLALFRGLFLISCMLLLMLFVLNRREDSKQ